MKHKKLWTILGIVVIAAAVIVFMICWNRSKTPHQVSRLPLMSSASAEETAKGQPKESSKATITYLEGKETLTVASTNKLLTTAGLFSYPEYLFTDPNAVSKDPALFLMWNNHLGSIDDDMKNALYFACNPGIRAGRITKFNDAGKYQKGHWAKTYRFYTVHHKLTNYDYTNGDTHYNVSYLYNPDGTLRKVTFANGLGFSMDISILYKDGLSCGFRIHDSASKKTTTDRWKTRTNAKGRIVSLKTDTRTYGFKYDQPGGYLTQICLDNRYRITYSYGKGHRIEKVESIVNINRKRASTLIYQFQYDGQKL